MWDIHLGNAFELMKRLEDSSVHLIVTDPPYFLDGMNGDWDHQRLQAKAQKSGVVGGLPVGMRFDPSQGKQLQKFMENMANEAYRLLKPGGFFIVFSQARLYHRLAVAIEDSGFEIRDMLGWKYDGQAKAFSMTHFIRKMNMPESWKEEVIKKLDGRKTPQLKPNIEPIVLAQKPKEGTFVENWLAYETGLIDVTASLDGKFPSNIMEVKKPSRAEKGQGNDHLTVKPLALMRHLIRLFSKEHQLVFDPFQGSGSTGVACVETNRAYLGIEIDPAYFKIAQTRLEMAIGKAKQSIA